MFPGCVLVTEQCGREFGVALQQSVLAIVVTIRYLDTSELSVALQQSVLSIVVTIRYLDTSELSVALQQSVLSIEVTIRYLDTSLGRLDTVCFISE
jgi:stage V sporulation protein SpoVS